MEMSRIAKMHAFEYYMSSKKPLRVIIADLMSMIHSRRWDLFDYFVDMVIYKAIHHKYYEKGARLLYIVEYGFVHGWHFTNEKQLARIRNGKRDKMRIIAKFFPYFAFEKIICDYVTFI